MIETLTAPILTRGDIGHVALLLWAISASALALVLLRELARTSSRFEAFVMAIARLNALLATDQDRPSNKPTQERTPW